jgi:DNA polymerase-3 subunit delta'
MEDEYLQFLKTDTVKSLKTQSARGTIKNGYLLITPDTGAARSIFTLFTLMLYCEKGFGNICFECKECKKVLSGNHSGIRAYISKFGVAEAGAIVEDLYIKPLDGNYKVYYISDFGAVTVPAQNKLLKSLEEPPEYAVFFLSASNEDAILKTVASRCEKHYEQSFDKAEARAVLEEEFDGDNFIDKAVLCADGFVDKARNMMNDAEFRAGFFECVDMLNNLKKSGQVVGYIFKPLFEKERLKTTLNILETVINATVRGIETRDVSLIFVRDTPSAVLNKYIFLIAAARKKAAYNVNSAAIAENLLMNMLEIRYLCR